jgi:hypothetical protein
VWSFISTSIDRSSTEKQNNPKQLTVKQKKYNGSSTDEKKMYTKKEEIQKGIGGAKRSID